MESLAHVKNVKTMLKMDEAPEFGKLVNFVDGFLNIGDAAKTKDYVKYLIGELKILSLLELANKNFSREEEKKLAKEEK